MKIKDSFTSVPKIRLDYNDYWNHRVKHYFQERYMVFDNEIIERSTVLDIGCGDGTNLEYLTKTKSIEGFGIDISIEAVELCNQKGLNTSVQDITNKEWKIDREFDYIILSEVLEHVTMPEEIIEKVCKSFEKKLLVSIPNIAFYKHRLRLLRGYFPIQWVYHPSEHLRYWSLEDFRLWIKNFDLEISKEIPINGTRFFYKYFPNIFANQVVFIIAKKGR